MTLTSSFSVDYDFALRYRRPEVFAVGDEVKSGTTDDFGQVIEFPGLASVVAIQSEYRNGPTGDHLVFIKHFSPYRP